MKKSLIVAVSLITVVLCLCMTACTMKLSDPSVTDEKAKLEYVQVKAENGSWHDLSGDEAEQLFEIVKSVGELSGEALDIAISGNSTIMTTYDYTFKMAFTTGNFFLKKRGEFTYNVGERFKRTYSDGKVSERITEEKLVVMKSLSKDTAMLSETQLQAVKDIFEPINAEIMSKAFDRIAEELKGTAYDVEVIPAEELAGKFYEVCQGGANYAAENLLKGYKISGPSDENHVFLCSNVEWAMKTDGVKGISRVGRVCYTTAGSCAGMIEEILKS